MSTPLRERPDAPLGTLIFRAGLLPAETIESALEEGVKTGKRLGEILTERGLIKEADLARLLAGQKALSFVALREQIVDPHAAALLSEDQARLFRALPYAFEDGRPVVAIADPTDEVLTRNVRDALGRDDATFVVSARSELIDLIGEVYADGVPVPAPVPAPAPAPEPAVQAAPETPEPPRSRFAVPAPEPPVETLAVTPAPEVPAPHPEAPAAPLDPEPMQEAVAAEAPPPVSPEPAEEPLVAAAPAEPEPEPAVNGSGHLNGFSEHMVAPIASVVPAPAPVPIPELAPVAEPAPAAASVESQPVVSEPSFEVPAPAAEPPAADESEPPAEEDDGDPVASTKTHSVHRVSVRLTTGERVEVGSFDDLGAATAEARALMAQVAVADAGDWPFVNGRFLKPDTIVSVDLA